MQDELIFGPYAASPGLLARIRNYFTTHLINPVLYRLDSRRRSDEQYSEHVRRMVSAIGSLPALPDRQVESPMLDDLGWEVTSAGKRIPEVVSEASQPEFFRTVFYDNGRPRSWMETTPSRAPHRGSITDALGWSARDLDPSTEYGLRPEPVGQAYRAAGIDARDDPDVIPIRPRRFRPAPPAVPSEIEGRLAGQSTSSAKDLVFVPGKRFPAYRFEKAGIYHRRLDGFKDLESRSTYIRGRIIARAERLEMMAKMLWDVQGRARMNTRQAARYFGVSTRTIYRDARLLRDMTKEDLRFSRKSPYWVGSRARTIQDEALKKDRYGDILSLAA